MDAKLYAVCKKSKAGRGGAKCNCCTPKSGKDAAYRAVRRKLKQLLRP